MDFQRQDHSEDLATPGSRNAEADKLREELRKVQIAYRESEERVNRLFTYAPEAIVMLDTETGRFIDANPRAEALFGLSREQLADRGPVDMSPTYHPVVSSRRKWRRPTSRQRLMGANQPLNGGS